MTQGCQFFTNILKVIHTTRCVCAAAAISSAKFDADVFLEMAQIVRNSPEFDQTYLFSDLLLEFLCLFSRFFASLLILKGIFIFGE